MHRPRGRPRTTDHKVEVRLTAAQRENLRFIGQITGRSDSAVLADTWETFWDSIKKAGLIQ